MSDNQETKTSHWGKAIIAAVIFLLILFILFSRSSCSQSLEAAKNASTQSEATESEGSEQKEEEEEEETGSAESPSKEDDDKDVEKESENTDEAEEKADPKPEKSPSEEKAETQPEEESNEAETNSPATPTKGEAKEEETASGGAGKPSGQSIGGLSVRGERLGVILDVSGSMQRYLVSLRKEIRTGFADAEFREVEGCFLEPVDPSSTIDPTTVSRDSVMDAIAELARDHHADSIYWFCDLQDERTEEALKQLKAIALGQSNSSDGFRLYIRSTDELPDPILEEIIRSSGGAFERSR